MSVKYILFVLLLVVLAGCTQKITCTKPYILVGSTCCLDTNSNGICDSDESQKSVTPTQKTAQAPETNTTTQVQEQKTMNATIKELLTRAKIKVKSLSYTYFGPPNQALGLDFTYISNSIKVRYASTQWDDRKNPYDTVYLNSYSKSAVGYCENMGCNNKDLKITLSYDDHYRIMPLEILDTITFAEQTGTERIDNRDAIILNFEDAQKRTGTMSVDSFWGLPLQIEYLTPTHFKIEYRDIAVNSVTDSDVMH